MLANYQITWFEEALPPDDLQGYIELTRSSPVPIATGEVLTRRQSFLPWIERGALDELWEFRGRAQNEVRDAIDSFIRTLEREDGEVRFERKILPMGAGRLWLF